MAFTHCSIYHEEHEGHEESRGKNEAGHPASKEPGFPSCSSIPPACNFHLALLQKAFFTPFRCFMVKIGIYRAEKTVLLRAKTGISPQR